LSEAKAAPGVIDILTYEIEIDESALG